MIEVGSDFSGVGALEQALMRLNLNYKTIFACDKDKFARQSYIANYGEPKYFPTDVYDRKIPTKSLDLYVSTPPCQSFSMAGNRKGESDDRGILFYNSHEFIKVNKPRHFIFENVKGLLSDDEGKTFQRWINMLGGKSVNGYPVIFPHEDAVPYHIYYKVLNAKKFGVPQNRERIFIVGIRDDCDNTFTWPKDEPLIKRLKDVLEDNVDEKYYLSNKMLTGFLNHAEKHKSKGNGFGFKLNNINEPSNPITNPGKIRQSDNYIEEVNIGAIRGRNLDDPKSRKKGEPTEQRLEVNKSGTSNAITTVQKDNVVVYGNLKGGKWDKTHEQSGIVYDPEGIGATVHTTGGGGQEPKIIHGYRIRRLTPRECFRLMDFPDSFQFVCSNSQLYKQAGNSIPVAFLEKIIRNLNLNR